MKNKMLAVLTVCQRIRSSLKGLLEEKKYLDLSLSGKYEADEERGWQKEGKRWAFPCENKEAS